MKEKKKYVWISESSSKTCDDCSSLDGEEFDSLDKVPDKPHPNCKCEIEEIVSSSSPSNHKDTIRVKGALAALGYYKTPEEGITPYTDNAMYDGIKNFQKDNKLYIDGVMKPNGETINKINENLTYPEQLALYLSSKGLDSVSEAGMQGLSLGWSDEINGIMGGTGYALGSLNKNWNKTEESTKEAFKRGYIKARDERRNLLEQGYKRSPTAMMVMESVGAIANPISEALAATKTTPLTIKSRKNLIEALATGGIYGMGTSEGSAKDYIKNISRGMISSYGSSRLSKLRYGNGNTHVLGRKITNEISSISLNNLLNYNYDERGNK